MALKPLTHPDDLYQLLREGKIKEFNQRKAQADRVKLNDCDFRHIDLRGIDAQSVDFRNCYFHNATCAASISPKRRSKGQASIARGFPACSSPRISARKKSSCR